MSIWKKIEGLIGGSLQLGFTGAKIAGSGTDTVTIKDKDNGVGILSIDKVTGLSDPAGATDAASKGYTDVKKIDTSVITAEGIVQNAIVIDANGLTARTTATPAWVEVAPQHESETQIYSLVVFNNKLYGGTYPNGNLVEWNGTDAWVEVAPQHESETAIYSLAVFNNKLYGGTYPNGNLVEWNASAPERVDINEDGTWQMGDPHGANIRFNSDEELILTNITIEVTKEIIIGAPSWHLGASAPDEDFVGLGDVLLFDQTTEEHVHYTTKIPIDYKAGTDIEIIVCWSFDTEEVGKYVMWELSYLSLATGEDPAGAGTNIWQTSAVTTADGDVSEDKLICTTFGTDLTGLAADDTLILKFGRDSDGTHGTDDLAQDARLHSIHLHYTADKLGT